MKTPFTSLARRLLNYLFTSGHKTVAVSGWRDNIQSFTSAKLAGSKNPSFSSFKGGIGAYEFSNTQEQELIVYFHVDHDYAEGTAIYPHVHWSPSNANGGVVRWGMEFTWARGHQQEAFRETATIYLEQDPTSVQALDRQHCITETPDPGITLDGLEVDSVIMCRVFRDATHVNDTYGAGAFGIMADIHYQSNKVATIGKRPDFNVPD